MAEFGCTGRTFSSHLKTLRKPWGGTPPPRAVVVAVGFGPGGVGVPPAVVVLGVNPPSGTWSSTAVHTNYESSTQHTSSLD